MQLRSLWRWPLLVAVVLVPLVIAASSPLLAWREPVYIAAALAGILAFSLLLCQPLLIGEAMPGLRSLRARRLHRILGIALVVAVAAHVAGLWVTSPPDVIDALLFRSPTPFSLWGVIAMWATFAAAALAVLRRKLPIAAHHWRFAHTSVTALVVVTSVAHAMLIDGTMGNISKAMLSVAIVAATIVVVVRSGSWKALARKTPRH